MKLTTTDVFVVIYDSKSFLKMEYINFLVSLFAILFIYIFRNGKLKDIDLHMMLLILLIAPLGTFAILLLTLSHIFILDNPKEYHFSQFSSSLLRKIEPRITLGSGVQLYRICSTPENIDDKNSYLGMIDFPPNSYLTVKFPKDMPEMDTFHDNYHEFLVLNENLETIKSIPMCDEVTFTSTYLEGAVNLSPGKYIIWFRKFSNEYFKILAPEISRDEITAVFSRNVVRNDIQTITNIPKKEYLDEYAADIHQDEHRRYKLADIISDNVKLFPPSPNLNSWSLTATINPGEICYIFFDKFNPSQTFITLMINGNIAKVLSSDNKHLKVFPEENMEKTEISFVQVLPKIVGIDLPRPFAKVYSAERSHFFTPTFNII